MNQKNEKDKPYSPEPDGNAGATIGDGIAGGAPYLSDLRFEDAMALLTNAYRERNALKVEIARLLELLRRIVNCNIVLDGTTNLEKEIEACLDQAGVKHK